MHRHKWLYLGAALLLLVLGAAALDPAEQGAAAPGITDGPPTPTPPPTPCTTV